MTEQQTIKKFSEEYRTEKFEFDGKQTEVIEILDKEIVIYNFAKLNGTYGDFAVIDGELNGTRIQFIFNRPKTKPRKICIHGIL